MNVAVLADREQFGLAYFDGVAQHSPFPVKKIDHGRPVPMLLKKAR